ncbi:MAG TPA: class I SAM-dependent methyltransferase [Pyrinomonadaceae bacterium]|nr:class I SAM-dependent methyltransferase [Pyrinomonadaceae bacterium]
MKLNRAEKALMNNPVRAFIQRHYESRLLERLGGRTQGMRVLEVGCGRGVGTGIIFERFGAREVYAFDLDPDMIDRAKRRLSSYGPERLRISVGDVTKIDADDRSFDAVVDFGILHHVPRWQEGVAEIGRVLRPGGRFFFEEVSSRALNRRAYRALFEYPVENRFSRDEFVGELERQGIAVGDKVVERLFGDFFFGVGVLREETCCSDTCH